ncbi:Alcohol dehydrogenase superfamily, zinc-type [Penicillium expansum]|uniref:Alcohol dehydrogenase superfamily, zinc-type n=1 Tax=Penicillium expansum TaxID=27334 RepID=A0A0A2KTF0_PENEN|nr:Alcohol dehydrogenase superfamily, zinc-type [Penicillium expansum]KGO38228.1 Alcohol dehydrogenase superfamily, zinc-type [Penicillium expansum]KGO54577.1 Alcohol dehydrogenase superfamily, zinc-type [Penicillium expansum]KGO70198.1 Alcohol dehydrogenase superfamily, zinc-type [Penicillium expansum]
MSLQKAIIVDSPKNAQLVSDRVIPTLRDDCILVKNVSVALNPTDWKHIDFLAPPGVLVGCDYAGIVEDVGKDVKKSFKKGDRVCGFVHGSNAVQPEDGAFAEYIVAKGDLQYRIPESMTFEEAATLGLGATTAALGLYQSLRVPIPASLVHGEKKTLVLIYGGSTATGTLAIQFAKLSDLGADVAFDYNDPKSANMINDYTNDCLTLAFDTISVESSAKYCDISLSSQGGDYSALLPIKIVRDNIRDRATMAYTAFGEKFTFGPNEVPARPEDRAFLEVFCGIFEGMLLNGKIKVHPPRISDGGLNGVLDGLQLLKEGKISGQKLVYNIKDTL